MGEILEKHTSGKIKAKAKINDRDELKRKTTKGKSRRFSFAFCWFVNFLSLLIENFH